MTRHPGLRRATACAAALVLGCLMGPARAAAADERADLILYNGRVVTVDAAFTVAQAVAIRDGRLLRVGGSEAVMALRGPRTQVVDLGGRMVLPGLMDSHTHPGGASMYEFDHPIPPMESVADVLAYVRQRAAALPEGDWIQIRQVFITRLRERRYPTRAELDAAAPKHPVVFSTGPDASVNSLALEKSGITRDTPDQGNGRIERDPATGEPTGVLRSAGTFLKGARSTSRPVTGADRDARLLELVADYHRVGLTAIADRNCDASAQEMYRRLSADGRLTIRMALSRSLRVDGTQADVETQLDAIAADPLSKGTPRLRIVGVKTFLDGGMLTGSAYLREPWGVSAIYSITDPNYRGLLYIPPERLLPIVRATAQRGLQFTAHSVGDGAVHTLLDVYETLSREPGLDLRATRPCLTHANFLSREAVDEAAALGVVLDVQPAWLWLDGGTLREQFGEERLAWFQPLAALFRAGATVGGGSDHMQRIDALRATNPYDPFLGMWITLTRVPRGGEAPLHAEQRLSREQALRMYTIQNARVMFLDKDCGSLEPGKLADLVVIDRDLLECPVDEVRTTRVLATYVEGRRVYAAPDAP